MMPVMTGTAGTIEPWALWVMLVIFIFLVLLVFGVMRLEKRKDLSGSVREITVDNKAEMEAQAATLEGGNKESGGVGKWLRFVGKGLLWTIVAVVGLVAFIAAVAVLNEVTGGITKGEVIGVVAVLALYRIGTVLHQIQESMIASTEARR